MTVGGFQGRICALTIAAVAMLLGSGREAGAHVGTGIDLDREGRIYFTDTYHNCIYSDDNSKHVAEISKRTPVGKVTVIVGSDRERQDGQGGETPPLSHVNSAICAPDGSLYLRDDQTIRRVAPDGTISTLGHSE